MFQILNINLHKKVYSKRNKNSRILRDIEMKTFPNIINNKLQYANKISIHTYFKNINYCNI